MTKTLYHGSDHIIERPMFGFGKTYNDYGQGFYCTDTLEMAKEWGVTGGKSGYANQYVLETDGLAVLDLNAPPFGILHWMALLLKHREFDLPSPLAAEAKAYLLQNFMPETENCDCIVGYRADDSYFSFAQDFINGTISLRQLGNAMHLGKLGLQFVLKSERSFEKLHFVGYEIAESGEWFAKKMARDRAARREYFDVERNRRRKGDLYITQIMDEEMKPNDPRLRTDLS